MPPKVKITKDEIIKTAVELIRQEGESGLNARSIAASLGCSTQPIFSNFKSMEELDEAVIAAAHDRYLEFVSGELASEKYPPYKAYGMAYIRFAKEEKNLFKMLFMCDRDGKDLSPTEEFNVSVEIIMNANGVTRDKAELMHLEMWTFVHGIGVMLATSFLPLDWDLISDMISDIYQGLRARHVLEDK